MRFQSGPNLKPSEIQPPTTERRTPAVFARKPAPRARLRRALRKGGTIALNGGKFVLNLLKNSGFLIKSSRLWNSRAKRCRLVSRRFSEASTNSPVVLGK
jgi:hypothetical protein